MGNIERGNYCDPVDLIWTGAARRMGWVLHFTPEVYASWDGDHTLSVSTPEHYDPDDSLAQLVLHEVCHALVEWPEGYSQIDWGLGQWEGGHSEGGHADGSNIVREHACHRLQAALLDEWGLRHLFAPTTDHRPYYDALPEDPLSPPDEPAVRLARQALAALPDTPMFAPLHDALRATAAIAQAVAPFAEEPHVWSRARPARVRTPESQRLARGRD